MLDDESINLILLAALAVNLRMAMYAATLAMHLGRIVFGYLNFNQSYMASIAKNEDNPNLTMPKKVIYSFWIALVMFINMLTFYLYWGASKRDLLQLLILFSLCQLHFYRWWPQRSNRGLMV